ncbi:hypothetical protein K493DRAFT_154077, partial [Basidiobolus meristosporus CBS 931.73]
CQTSMNTTCPSFEGVRNETIQGLVNFLFTSKCTEVSVVGGTEILDSESYYSHKRGFRVDFSSNPCIDKFIKNNFHYIGNRKYGTPDKLYVACSGNMFAWKQDHWEMSAY